MIGYGVDYYGEYYDALEKNVYFVQNSRSLEIDGEKWNFDEIRSADAKEKDFKKYVLGRAERIRDGAENVINDGSELKNACFVFDNSMTNKELESFLKFTPDLYKSVDFFHFDENKKERGEWKDGEVHLRYLNNNFYAFKIFTPYSADGTGVLQAVYERGVSSPYGNKVKERGVWNNMYEAETGSFTEKQFKRIIACYIKKAEKSGGDLSFKEYVEKENKIKPLSGLYRGVVYGLHGYKSQREKIHGDKEYNYYIYDYTEKKSGKHKYCLIREDIKKEETVAWEFNNDFSKQSALNFISQWDKKRSGENENKKDMEEEKKDGKERTGRVR